MPTLLLAQPAPPEPPSPRELREEQRIILNAYIKRGEEYLAKSREQLADNRLKASKENGFHAVELLARARAKLDKHPEKIEQLHGLFIGEGTRDELRKNLRENIDPRYFSLQEHLENVAGQLADKGDKSLQQSLEYAKKGDLQEFLAVQKRQDIQSVEPGGADSGTPSGGGSGGSSGSPKMQLRSGGTVSQDGPNSVSIDLPSGAHASIAGTLSSDGSSIDSPQYGKVDLNSGVKLPDGSTAFQTSKGVLVVGADGTENFIPGAKLNSDGSAKLVNGTTVSLANLHKDGSGNLVTGDNVHIDSQGRGESSGGSSSSSGGGGSGFKGEGHTPAGITFVDEKGNPITVDPDWENGEQKGVRRDYLGGKGARLVSEAKVVRKIVQSSNNQCVVSVVPGESRTWKLSIATGETRNVAGNVQIPLTLADSGGLTDFTVKGWDATSTSGAHATVAPSADKPNEATATFSQDGDYEITVTGETSWGSPFKITGKSGIYR